MHKLNSISGGSVKSMLNMISNNFHLSTQRMLSFVSMMALNVLLGCSSAPQGLEIQTVATNLPTPEKISPLPNPVEIQTFPIHWVIITKDHLPDGDFVYYGLSVKDYENLSLTNADTVRWIKEASWLLNYYHDQPPLGAGNEQ